MSRRDRRQAGDRTPLELVPEGQGDEPRIRLSRAVIASLDQAPDGWNPYRCEDCGQIAPTVHAHRGVTPAFMACRYCGGQARSGWYPDAPMPAALAFGPLWEWYRPSVEEFSQLGGHTRSHVELGGLLIRKRTVSVPAALREETNPEKRSRLADLFQRPTPRLGMA